ncbi:helix-turn-helix transcriptional regulator [Thalassobacillus pellis]|uniref:helix-turn-helix transcriptional regulator n=1 Tax=Thalassobacillus pellis TaxID=748008 RepID=UPI001961380D|nr:helix-turn-helix transcriptional regulator [Thalassobacillus pellis]MBM7551159.1 tetratricopeptide (TPR) repeat protein [Thalassobacillus pellis]
MHIGNRIQIMRNNRNLTLKQTADTITSTSYLAKIEEGNYPPKPHVLQALERKFEIAQGFLTNYEHRDEDAEYILRLLQSNIVLHPDKAKEVIDVIEENYYEYLSPINLEATYLCLKCAYFYKINDTKSAIDLYETYLIHYIDETELRSYPKLVRESFNYMMALKTFSENKIKDCTYYMEMFVDSVEQSPMKAAVIYNIALLYGKLNLHSKAIQFGLKAKFMFEYTKKYELLLCKTNNLLAAQHLESGLYEEALQYLNQAELPASRYGYTNLLSLIYHNKGLIYTDLENYTEAKNFFQKAINLELTEGRNPLPVTYKSFIDLLVISEEKELGIELYESMINNEKLHLDQHQITILFTNFILKYLNEEKYMTELHNAIEHYENTQEKNILYDVYHSLGDYYYQESDYKQASFYFKKALKIKE